jgi:hypothetical protein
MMSLAEMRQMARTELTIQDADITSLNVTDALTAAIADGHKFLFNDRAWILVDNGNASALTLTLKVPSTVLIDGGIPVADHTISIAAGKMHIAPIKDKLMTQTDDMVYVDYSLTASVNIIIFKDKNL